MQVIRYFHIHPEWNGSINRHKLNGATIKVAGDTEIVGQVDVQVTFCSKKDAFCKATGRAEAEKAPIKVVPLRYLPNELARLEDQVYGYKVKNKGDFLYAMRYFLPKE